MDCCHYAPIKGIIDPEYLFGDAQLLSSDVEHYRYSAGIVFQAFGMFFEISD